ncbi:MAG: aa3-type cytochrome c oxidase subunit IV [Methylocella sp.]
MTNDHAGSVATMNYDEHEKTFRLFVRLLAYGAVGVAGILILLAIIAG